MPGWGAIITAIELAALALLYFTFLILVRRARDAKRREAEDLLDEFGEADHYSVFHEDAK